MGCEEAHSFGKDKTVRKQDEFSAGIIAHSLNTYNGSTCHVADVYKLKEVKYEI